MAGTVDGGRTIERLFQKALCEHTHTHAAGHTVVKRRTGRTAYGWYTAAASMQKSLLAAINRIHTPDYRSTHEERVREGERERLIDCEPCFGYPHCRCVCVCVCTFESFS